MKRGEEIEVTIDHLGGAGDGVARVNGRSVFVPQALPGETLKVKLSRSVGDAYQADILAMLETSSSRIEPVCPHYSRCGGCMAQHMSDGLYRQWKTDVIKEALVRQRLYARGSGVDALVREIQVVPAGARRRVTLAAVSLKGRDKPVIGFNAKASHHIVPIEDCPLMCDELVRLLPLLSLTLEPWIRLGKALDVGLTLTDSGIDVLVTGSEPDLAARETAALMFKEPSIARLSWRRNERSGAEPVIVSRVPAVSFGGVRVTIPAGGFLQPSMEVENFIIQNVLSALLGGSSGLGRGYVADLFCGSGCFAFPVAREFSSLKAVNAFDGDAMAVEALVEGARASSRGAQIHGEVRDLFREPLTIKELAGYSAIVFDPPRAGALAQVKQIAGSTVPVVVGVSCNPVTFARDAAVLVEGGYQLDWVQPVDQFTWSSHVELVARFCRPDAV